MAVWSMPVDKAYVKKKLQKFLSFGIPKGEQKSGGLLLPPLAV